MNVMIDLETMSTRNNAAVASLGACYFDPRDVESVDQFTNERLFYVKIDLTAQRGRDFDGDTIYWWLQQDEAARRTLCANRVGPIAALKAFDLWYQKVNGGNTWSFGATFDHVILNDLYTWLGLKYPIHYRDQLCMRTMVKVSGVERPVIPSIVGHRAVDDAVLQAIWLQKCIAALRGLNQTERSER